MRTGDTEPQSSIDFGQHPQRRLGYDIIASTHPDDPVEKIASHVISLSKILEQRFDVNSRVATDALIESLEKEIVGEEVKDDA